MQKLWLKNFEHHISTSTWAAAEELLEQGRVKAMKEVEKHFWVTTVEEGETTFEVEMMITPHKIKAYHCECFTEGRRLMCAHVAASFVKVRQYLDNQVAEKQAKKEAKNQESHELSRLTIHTILETASPEALLDFVRDYARRDRDFSLALKTYFAGAVSQSENPFALLLDSIIPKAGVNRPFRDPDFRRLRNTLDDIIMQMERAEKQFNWPIAYQIASAIATRISAFLGKNEGQRRAFLLENFQTAILCLQKIYGADVSPEMKDSSWQLIFQMGENAILPVESLRETLSFLSKTAFENQRFEAIRDLFDRTVPPAPPFVLHLYLAAMEARRMPEASIRILADYEDKADVIFAALLQLYYLNLWKSTTIAAEHFIEKKIFDTKQQRELEDILLHIAEKSNDKKRQIIYLKNRFAQSGSLEVLERLKKLYDADWAKQLGKLLDLLREKGDNDKIAAIWASGQNWPELMAHLNAVNQMPLFQRHEARLLAWDKSAVRDFYLRQLSLFLSLHFGTPAAAQVRNTLQSLLQKGEVELVGEIIRKLSVQFPDRTGLANELSEIFPRHLRKKAMGT